MTGLLLWKNKMHSMPPHYSFIFTTDMTRKLHTKLSALFSVHSKQGDWEYAKVLRKYWGVNLGQRIKQASKSLYLTGSFISLCSLCQE